MATFFFCWKIDICQISRHVQIIKKNTLLVHTHSPSRWNDTRGCAHISWNLPYSWGKHRKTSARRPSDEGCATSHRLKWSTIPPNEVCRSHSTSGWEKEGKKKRTSGQKIENLHLSQRKGRKKKPLVCITEIMS